MSSEHSFSDIFKNFTGREDDLRSITRYSLYDVMFYRTNLLTHSERVAALVRAINPAAMRAFGADYDPKKAEIMAHVHDDAEIIFGDVQAGNKSRMTKEQLAAVHAAEKSAIDEIANRFPTSVGGYSYKQLLSETADKDTTEAQIVCYADKYDAMGEAMHEIYAGNQRFATNVVNEFGSIPTPLEYYADYFANVRRKLPRIGVLLDTAEAIFAPVEMPPFREIVQNGTPHTVESLKIPTQQIHYDNWLTVMLADSCEEVVHDLYAQKEYL